MDVTRASVSITGPDTVTISTKKTTIEATIAHSGGVWRLVKLTVNDGDGITGSQLSALPLRQITRVVLHTLHSGDEVFYRMLAAPRTPGKRHWDEEHYWRVKRVAGWAQTTARPGGAALCVAEFWDVHPRTARRWLAYARQLDVAP
jgi:hypothetical protein